jgi:hypothetical protein
MGYFHLNSGQIQNYDVVLVNEQYDNITITVVNVTIETDLGITKYRIASDDRHPNINRIEDSFEKGLSDALNNETSNIKINEYSERSYVFVDFPDGTSAQYTGARIQR